MYCAPPGIFLHPCQNPNPAGERVVVFAAEVSGGQALLVDELLDAAVGRGKGEDLAVAVPVGLRPPHAPLALVVPHAMAATEMPGRDTEISRIIDDPLPL